MHARGCRWELGCGAMLHPAPRFVLSHSAEALVTGQTQRILSGPHAAKPERATVARLFRTMPEVTNTLGFIHEQQSSLATMVTNTSATQTAVSPMTDTDRKQRQRGEARNSR